MAWFNQSTNNKWFWLFRITRELLGDRDAKNPTWCLRMDFTDKETNKHFEEILRKFLSEIDSPELVTFKELESEEFDPFKTRFGGRVNLSEAFKLFCLSEDKDKLLTDEPVRFLCYTEIETDDKEAFIEFIKSLIDN